MQPNAHSNVLTKQKPAVNLMLIVCQVQIQV